jgi:hypothetical protein
MERALKIRNLFEIALAFFVCFLLLTSSFSVTYASSATSNEVTLPDWLEQSIAFMYPNASSAKLDQVRAQVIEQIAKNQKRITDTNGAVLKYKPSDTKSGSYMYDYLYKEEWNGGTVTNPTYLEGLIDYNSAIGSIPLNYIRM